MREPRFKATTWAPIHDLFHATGQGALSWLDATQRRCQWSRRTCRNSRVWVGTQTAESAGKYTHAHYSLEKGTLVGDIVLLNEAGFQRKRCAQCPMQYTLCTIHFASCTVLYTPCAMHHAAFISSLSYFVQRTVHYAPCTLYYALYTIHYTLCTAHSVCGMAPRDRLKLQISLTLCLSYPSHLFYPLKDFVVWECACATDPVRHSAAVRLHMSWREFCFQTYIEELAWFVRWDD